MRTVDREGGRIIQSSNQERMPRTTLDRIRREGVYVETNLPSVSTSGGVFPLFTLSCANLISSHTFMARPHSLCGTLVWKGVGPPCMAMAWCTITGHKAFYLRPRFFCSDPFEGTHQCLWCYVSP